MKGSGSLGRPGKKSSHIRTVAQGIVRTRRYAAEMPGINQYFRMPTDPTHQWREHGA
jgi:hypothetical protein